MEQTKVAHSDLVSTLSQRAASGQNVVLQWFSMKIRSVFTLDQSIITWAMKANKVPPMIISHTSNVTKLVATSLFSPTDLLWFQNRMFKSLNREVNVKKIHVMQQPSKSAATVSHFLSLQQLQLFFHLHIESERAQWINECYSLTMSTNDSANLWCGCGMWSVI